MTQYTLAYQDMVLTRNLLFDYIGELKGKLKTETHHWARETLQKSISDHETTYRKIIEQIGA